MSAPFSEAEGFQPHGIYDFRDGLNLQREPWLSPENAWEEIENGYVFRGRTFKRRGYSKFGELGTVVVDEDLADTQAVSGTLVNQPVLPHELAPSLYEVNLREVGGGAIDLYDQPLGHTSNPATFGDGLFLETVTGLVMAGAGVGRTLSTTEIAMGFYADDSGLAAVNPVTGNTYLVDLKSSAPSPAAGTGAAFIIDDSVRKFPTPQQNMVISWDNPAPASITINTLNVFDDPSMNVAPGILVVGVGDLHADFNSGATNAFSCGAIGDSLILTFDVDPGVVLVSYSAFRGFIEYVTGDFSVFWEVVPTGDVVISYEYSKADPVMGIHGFFTQDGLEFLVACTNRDLWEYDTTEERFAQKTGSAEAGGPVASPWSGNDTQFFDFETFETFVLINNFNDDPQKYSPGASPRVTLMGVTFDSAPDQIDKAKLALRHKNRLVYLGTGEDGGTEHRARARWTPVNDVEYGASSDEAADDFVDAPVEDTIVSGTVVGEEIIVGMERSWWRLRYTGDVNGAFKWEPLLSEEGASGLNSAARLPENIFARGEKAMVSVDAVSQRPADQLIPDLTDRWNSDKRNLSNSHYSKEFREILTTFADAGEDTPDSVLSTHIDETRQVYSYSIYRIPTASGWYVFGTFRQGSVQTYNTTSQPYNQIQTSYNESLGQTGQPIVLIGDRFSNIWSYGTSFADDGNNVLATFRTKRLNPTPYARSHLGFVDITCDAEEAATLTVRVRKDYDLSHYFEKSFSLTPVGSSKKIKRRLSVNRIANFHTIELTIDNQKPFALDSIILYTKPAGLAQNIGL